MSSASDILRSRINITTTCCFAVNVHTSDSVVQGSTYVAAATFTLSAPPSSFLIVYLKVSYDPINRTRALLSNSEVLNPAQFIYPVLLNITAIDGEQPRRAVYLQPSAPAGYYHIAASLKGPSAYQYNIEASTDGVVQVLNNTFEPTPPILNAAQFNNDATSITVEFDSATDRGSIQGRFNCSRILSFKRAKAATCTWSGDKSIVILLSSTDTITAGDQILALPNVLRAKCSQPPCASLRYANASSSIVQGPSVPLVPRVSVSAPTVIGPCDGLLIDLTGSLGAGGRPWTSTDFTVYSPDPNATALQDYINSTQYHISPPTKILKEYFVAPFVYTFSFRLCNFLGRCGEGTLSVAVTNVEVPLVRIQGSSIRQMKSKAELKLFGSAFIKSCGGGEIYSNIDYKWSTFEEVEGTLRPVSSIVSISLDPKIFRVMPGSLTPQKTYVFQLQATYTPSSSTAVAAVTVITELGDIIAIIAGASSKSVTLMDEIVLDASLSYDEDRVLDPYGSQYLSFQWECFAIKPIFSPNCGLIVNSTAVPQYGKYNLIGTSPDSTSRITVTVRDLVTSRSATAVVDVYVVKGSSSEVEVDQSYVNIDRKLQFTGRIRTNAGGIAQWSINDPGIDLSSRALTPTYLSFSNADIAIRGGRINFGFALAGFTLLERMEYTFTMSFIPVTGKPVISSISLQTNGGPTPGALQINPAYGKMLSTPFSYVASLWTDMDIPITYAFAYTTDRSSFFVIQSRSELSYGTVLLPSGLERLDYVVDVRVEAFDSLSAGSTLVNRVKVEPQDGGGDIDQLWNAVETATSGREDKDSLKWSLGMATTVLNTINCTLAPDCAALNRQECSAVDNTCGTCLSEDYFGESFHSNSKCVLRSSANTTDTDAFVLLLSSEKQCENSCSGHGACVAYTFTDGSYKQSNETCLVGNANCQLFCSCIDGYVGSSCAYTNADILKRQNYREATLQKITALIEMEDLDKDTVQSLTTMVKSATEVAIEINEDAAAKAISVSTYLLKNSISMKLPIESTADCIKSIDSVLKSGTMSSTNMNLTTSLGLYGKAVANSMVVGEAGVGLVENFLRISIVTVDGAIDNVIKAPLASMETVINSRKPATAVINGVVDTSEDSLNNTSALRRLAGNSIAAPADSKLGVSLIEYNRFLLTKDTNLSLIGDPVQFFFSRDPCAGVDLASNCYVTVTIPFYISNNTKLASEFRSPSESFYMDCIYDSVWTANHTCSNAAKQILYGECNGTWAGRIQKDCFIDSVSPNCGPHCELIKYSREAVTCRCGVHESSAEVNYVVRDSSSVVVSPQFMPLLKSTLVTFANTWVYTPSSSDISNSLIVFLSTGVIAVFVIAILLVGIFRLDVSEMADAPAQGIKFAESDIASALVSSLPAIYSSNAPYLVKVIKELKANHRWLSVFFSDSSTKPRLIRALLLSGYLLLNMFGNALTFNTSMPDDATCAQYISETDCTYEESAFAKTSKCYWDAESGTCSFKYLKSDAFSILYIAILSSCFTIPLVLLQDYVVLRILNAPRVVTSERSIDKEFHRADANIELKQLLNELDIFRSRIEPAQRLIFESMWNNASPTSPNKKVLGDIVSTNAEVLHNKVLINQSVQKGHIVNANIRLLYLFQRDLLPYASAMIMDSKMRRDIDERPDAVPTWKRACGWAYLCVSNGSILAYLLLFGLQQSHARQMDWVRSLSLWLIVDIFVFSSFVAYMSNIYVPSLFARESREACDQLAKSILQKSVRQYTLNACKYLFTSYKVAEAFPDLFASKVILQYSSPWPRRSYRSSISIKGVLAMSILYLFEGLVELPPSIQDELCKMFLQLLSINALLMASGLDSIRYVAFVIFLVALALVLYLLNFATTKLFAKQGENLPTLNEPGTLSRFSSVSSMRRGSSLLSLKSLPTNRAESSGELGVDALLRRDSTISLQEYEVKARRMSGVGADEKNIISEYKLPDRRSSLELGNDAINVMCQYINTQDANGLSANIDGSNRMDHSDQIYSHSRNINDNNIPATTGHQSESDRHRSDRMDSTSAASSHRSREDGSSQDDTDSSTTTTQGDSSSDSNSESSNFESSSEGTSTSTSTASVTATASSSAATSSSDENSSSS